MMEFLRSLFLRDKKSSNKNAAADAESEHKGKSDKVVQTFIFFPKLPLELRNNIWNEHCVLSEPRIVDLWVTKHSTEEKMKYGTHSQAPPILHTSREARYIGLKYYNLLFEEEIGGEIRKDIESPGKPHIYVNWEHDILFPVPSLQRDPTRDDILLGMLYRLGNLQRLKRIAIPEALTNWVILIVDAKNLSEIIVYEPRHAKLYNRLEEAEEAYTAGIRFKIELLHVADDDLSPGCYGNPISESLLVATDDVWIHLTDDKAMWDLHFVQPIIKWMSVELKELNQ